MEYFTQMGNSSHSKVSSESLNQLLDECAFKLNDSKENVSSSTPSIKTEIDFENLLYKDYSHIVNEVLPNCIFMSASAEIGVVASELSNSDMAVSIFEAFQEIFPGRVFPEDTKRKLKRYCRCLSCL